MSGYDSCHKCEKWVPSGETECPHCGAQQGLVASTLAWLVGLTGPKTAQPVRKSGQLCVSCRRLVGVDDEKCPYCDVPQTQARKAARAIADALPNEGFTATWAFLAFNVLLFIAPLLALMNQQGFDVGTYLSNGDPKAAVLSGALYTPLVEKGQYWRFVTAGYLHFGIIHLGFNMYALSFLGRMVEDIYGRGWFTLMYVVTGICAFLLTWAVNPLTLSAGASGPIFGVIGIALAVCWRNRWANRAMLRQLLIWIGITYVLGMMMPLDNWAHTGGLVSGAALGWLLPPDRVTRSRQLNVLGDRLGAAAAVSVGICFGLAISWASSVT